MNSPQSQDFKDFHFFSPVTAGKMGQKCGEEYAHLNISQSKGVFPFQRLCGT